jgi:hypothetical protein
LAGTTGGPEPASEPPRMPVAAQGASSADDRAELVRLRAEVERLRAQVSQAPGAGAAGGATAGAGRKRHISWRSPVSAVLITLGCILAPLAVLAVWTANQVSNTSRYVANVAPLIRQPAIQGALTDKITPQITSKLNVQGLTNQVATELNSRGLPKVATLLHSFSGTIAGGVAGFVHSAVAKVVASPAAARIWTQANQAAHAEIVKALSGQGNGAIKITNGSVTLGLGPFINTVKQDLIAHGLTVVQKIPPINPTFTLFSSKYLVKAQTGYRLINDLKIALPLLAIVLLAAGIYIAKRHRRALIGAGLGLAASMLVLAIGLAIGRAIYLNSVPTATLPSDAAAALFDTLVRFIKDGLRALLVLGLLVAAGGFFMGPSVTAVRTRNALKSGLGLVRARGERAGLSAGPVGSWTYGHRKALRIGAVVLMVLIFIFWSQPTGLVVLLLAIVLLVLLGLIELIGRPPVPRPAGQA